MGKMIYLMGKSSSGKDTVFKYLLENRSFDLKKVVPYTTRPIRAGEVEGEEYHFTDDAGFEKIQAEGKVIEYRIYNTYYGPWYYFTVDDDRIDLNFNNYLTIGTLESYLKTAAYFGKEKVLPVLLEVDDGERLQRALDRERFQKVPGYMEMCRRFLADAEDFAEEKIKEAGISKRFKNNNFDNCIKEIEEYIKEGI